MKRTLLFLSSIYVSLLIVEAQTGTIIGNVKDERSQETLIGATIMLEGTSKGTITDFNGDYVLSNIQPGKYNIICSYVAYEPMVNKDVVISENQQLSLNFIMKESTVSLSEVVITGKRIRDNEELLLQERKEASVAIESIGAKELALKGAGDAASGVKKVTGVSMIGSKQLFVRGLGDRYNAAQLNGLPLASPDPTEKVIKLDIFPTEIIEAISVSKVYSAKNYADYTGALIDIETKDYPLRPFFNVSVGIGYTDRSTFKPFSRQNSQGVAYLGLNTNSRVNAVDASKKTYKRSDLYGSNIFNTNFTPETFNAPVNTSFSVAGGKLYSIGKRKLGVLLSSSFSNNYITEPNALLSYLKRDGANTKYYVKEAFLYSTTFSNLLNVHYKRNAHSSISYNALYLVNGQDEYSIADGRNRDDDYINYLTSLFESHQLFNQQLIGKEKLGDKVNMEWGLGYGLASSDIPDAKVVALIDNNNDKHDFSFYRRNAQETKRMFMEQTEEEFSAKIGLSINTSDNGTLFTGLQSRYKTRDFDAYYYYYNIDSLAGLNFKLNEASQILDLESNMDNAKYSIKNGSSYDNKYSAQYLIYATYLNYIHKFNRLMVDIGFRVEKSDISITARNLSGREKEPIELKTNLPDIFPALNLKYKHNDNAIWRLSFSRTVTRPSFNEKSPGQIPPIGSSIPSKGNPDVEVSSTNPYPLVSSFSNNADIKFEVFPNPGDLFAVGVYGKYIENPIERITKLSGGDPFYTFINTRQGVATGVEVEGKKKFNNLFAGFNASYIYTQIKIDEGEGISLTNTTRPLQGASPYLVNADLGYSIKYGATTSMVSFVYNIYGKRIWSVGSEQVGDVYELPYQTIDIIIKNNIGKHFSLNLSAKNISNSTFILSQDYYNIDDGAWAGEKQIFKFKKGFSIGLGLSYKFQ